ncbi:hypothetical protein ROHU_030626 [Labeo rohita]|uniref:Uncharacterized protein n=1 Tax=Labeo rohita TaxID=84645 RepID=A0A498LTW4_LABRO|nr:hypothetical protein ROHU_030626 [Labeo rohita]
MLTQDATDALETREYNHSLSNPTTSASSHMQHFNNTVAVKEKNLNKGYVSCEEPTGGGMFRYDVEEMNVRAEMEESYQSTDK